MFGSVTGIWDVTFLFSPAPKAAQLTTNAGSKCASRSSSRNVKWYGARAIAPGRVARIERIVSDDAGPSKQGFDTGLIYR